MNFQSMTGVRPPTSLQFFLATAGRVTPDEDLSYLTLLQSVPPPARSRAGAQLLRQLLTLERPAELQTTTALCLASPVASATLAWSVVPTPLARAVDRLTQFYAAPGNQPGRRPPGPEKLDARHSDPWRRPTVGI